jgi:hypothetical protein
VRKALSSDAKVEVLMVCAPASLSLDEEVQQLEEITGGFRQSSSSFLSSAHQLRATLPPGQLNAKQFSSRAPPMLHCNCHMILQGQLSRQGRQPWWCMPTSQHRQHSAAGCRLRPQSPTLGLDPTQHVMQSARWDDGHIKGAQEQLLTQSLATFPAAAGP